MKKFVSFLLVITLLLSLGMTAMAKKSPTTAKKSTTTGTDSGIGLYDANDKLIARVPAKEVVRLGIASADKLPDDQKEAFKAAYEDAMNLEGKLVRRFFWLDIPEEYKNMEGFAYAKLSFTSRGQNVGLSVNGNDMETVRLGYGQYYAKLTEFGTVLVTSD